VSDNPHKPLGNIPPLGSEVAKSFARTNVVDRGLYGVYRNETLLILTIQGQLDAQVERIYLLQQISRIPWQQIDELGSF
jgi:hypothetical protein